MVFASSVRRPALLAGLARSLSRPGASAVPPHLRDYAATCLAGLITNARRQMIATGVRPLPAAVARSLAGFFPDMLLRKCRYGISGGLPLTVPALRLRYGKASVATFADIVVFPSEQAAKQADVSVWAGEVTRVMQCRRWGLAEFAAHTVRDAAALEQEVAANVSRFRAWQRDT